MKINFATVQKFAFLVIGIFLVIFGAIGDQNWTLISLGIASMAGSATALAVSDSIVKSKGLATEVDESAAESKSDGGDITVKPAGRYWS